MMSKPWVSEGKPIAPGQEIHITVNFKAPQEAGQYLTFYRLFHGDNIEFGEKVWVDANVEKPKAEEQPPVHVAPMEDQIMIDASVNKLEEMDPIMRSQQMLDKFDGDDLNKSVEIDAQSAESNEFKILDDIDKDE